MPPAHHIFQIKATSHTPIWQKKQSNLAFQPPTSSHDGQTIHDFAQFDTTQHWPKDKWIKYIYMVEHRGDIYNYTLPSALNLGITVASQL